MTFRFNKIAADLTLRETHEIRDTFARTLEHILGFDNFSVGIHHGSEAVGFHVRAVDKFNCPGLWGTPDVEQIRLRFDVLLPLTDAVDDTLNSEIARTNSFPGRVSRERTHMAWVLRGQFERLGHYSDEARQAFQNAFRRSMEDAGLLSLVGGDS